MANGITRYSLHPEIVQLIFGQSLSTHIVIQRLDSHNSTRLPTPGIVANHYRRLGVYAYSQGFNIRIGLRLQLPDIFKDRVGFCYFF